MTEQCRLIQGWFALFIQGLLGFMCILTLVVKRHNEVPQRNWIVWSLDALKQGLGSTFGHFANIILAVVINLDSFVLSSSVDECEWYCLSYLVDSTVGITLNLMMLTFVESITKRNIECSRYVKFGEYGNPPMMSLFLPQLSIWLFIVIITKCVTYSMQLYFAEPLGILMNYLLFSVQSNPKLELVVVMIIIPVTVNSLQFWVTDMFLKGAHAHDGSGNSHNNSDHRHGDDDTMMMNNNSNHSSDGSNNSYIGLTTASRSNTSNNHNDFSFPELLSPRSLDRAKKRLKRLSVKGRGSVGAVVQMTDYELSDALLLSKEEDDNYIDNYSKTSNSNHNFINENRDKSLLSPKQKATILQSINTNNNQNNVGNNNNKFPKQLAPKTISTLNSNTSSDSNSPNHTSNGNNNSNSSNNFSRYTLQNLNSNNNNDSISNNGNFINKTESGNNCSYSININNDVINSPISTPIASISTSNYNNNNNTNTFATFTTFPTINTTSISSPSSSYR